MEPINQEWLTEYKDFLTSTGRKANTVAAYTQALSLFILWYTNTIGDSFTPDKLTPIDLSEYKRWLMHSKKPATINKAMAALRVFCKWAAVKGYCQPGVGERIKNLPQGRRSPKWLDRKEQLQLIRAVQKYGTPRDAAFIMIMLHGGLRVEEVVNLKNDDVILSDRKAKVIVRYGRLINGGRCR